MHALKQKNPHIRRHVENIQQLLATVLGYQLDSGLVPYAWGPKRRTGGDYAWAQWMMAVMYAERTGHLASAEAEARIAKLLTAIQRLKKFRGWLYKGYDLETFQPAFDGYAFQPFYMMSLIVAGKIFPSLAPLTTSLLSDYDYSKSYDPATRSLSDYDIGADRRTHPIPLGGPDGMPGAERRLAYAVYSYLTEDLSPWLIAEEPKFQDLAGQRFLAVSKGFNFDICHMHLMLPEIGYYERSWEDFLYGTAAHMEQEGLNLFPIRSSPLEEGFEGFHTPNIEHHQSMPYLTWYWHPELPLIEPMFEPGLGFLRWNDHWRFYWSRGDKLVPAHDVHHDVELRFPQCADPLCPNPTRLIKLRIFASGRSANARIKVTVNGNIAGYLKPGITASWVELEMHEPVQNANEVRLIAEKPGSVKFYRYATSIKRVRAGDREVPGIAAEVLCSGPYVHTPGSENSENALVEDTCTALSVRLQTLHEYSLWYELLNDPRFLRTQVNWVGEYHAVAQIGEAVYNVSDRSVRVEYLRKPEWADPAKIAVDAARAEITEDFVYWEAEPRTLYRISYAS